MLRVASLLSLLGYLITFSSPCYFSCSKRPVAITNCITILATSMFGFQPFSCSMSGPTDPFCVDRPTRA
ncbi:uncharacterized protein BDW43DRAFT_282850 [Aspergillus alliaceus]|uniref:uncharacterized protein n=1 Tax=Petromyces alliaceus TaxID=209559 RepID=UPI0012A5AE29|nr:uncharacterized protein BDW43DRAFT_282850 [Aspergillus alliaceus]KAB8231368.1 hypothetical protein BDW43DRAFT_282850 [Aspergillus alliaceus]